MLSLSQEHGQTIARGARNQANVVFALMYKELKFKLTKGRLGLVWTILEPAAHMIVLSSIWYLIGRETIDNVSVLLFISSGLLPFILIRKCLSSVARAIYKNKTLLDYQQVKPIDAVVASFAVEVLLLLIATGLLYACLGWFFGFYPEIPRPLEAIAILFVTAACGFGLGLTVAVLGSFDEGVFNFVNILSRPLLFISAVFYAANQLPLAIIEYLRWNPFLQFIEFYRYHFLGTHIFSKADLAYILFFSFGIFTFSLILYYSNRYSIIQR